MNKLNFNSTPGRFQTSGLSRSALMRRRLTPGSSPAESEKPTLLKTSLSTPRTSAVSKIVDKSVITKKKLEFAGHKCVEEKLKASENKNKSADYESFDENQLTELLKARKEELEVLRRHQKEKTKLIEYTARWKEVGNEALEILTEKYFKMSRQQLIHKMALDDDVFD